MKGFFLYVAILFVLSGPPAMAATELPMAESICVNKANILIREGRFDQAADLLEAFRKKRNRDVHYYIDFLLGNSLMMGGRAGEERLTRAARAYERALAEAPDLSPAWLNLAQCRYSLGHMKTAADAFLQGYETAEEKKAVSLYHGAACRFFAGQHQEALNTFHRLLDTHPGEIELGWKEILVNILFALEKNREALPWLRELADQSEGKKKKQWQEVLLYHYLNLKMDKAALDYALFLTRSDPAEPRWWKSLTHIHLDKNRLEKGLRSLMIYGFLTPLSRGETSLLADLYAACNIPLEAARCYEDWISRQGEGDADPTEITKKIYRIATAYMLGGDRAAAMAWADKGLAMAGHKGLLRLKADLLFQDKRFEAALQAYERLARFKAEAGRANLMAGYAAWNLNRLAEAQRLFEAAAASPGQKKAAAGALARVRKILAQARQQGQAASYQL